MTVFSCNHQVEFLYSDRLNTEPLWIQMPQGVISSVEILLPHCEGCKEVRVHKVPLVQFVNMDHSHTRKVQVFFGGGSRLALSHSIIPRPARRIVGIHPVNNVLSKRPVEGLLPLP